MSMSREILRKEKPGSPFQSRRPTKVDNRRILVYIPRNPVMWYTITGKTRTKIEQEDY